MTSTKNDYEITIRLYKICKKRYIPSDQNLKIYVSVLNVDTLQKETMFLVEQ